MIYLIDTENVASEWIGKFYMLGMDSPDSKIIIAYTDKSSKLSYDQISFLLQSTRQDNIYFTKCRNGKPNALDFHIIGTVTKMLLENKDEEYVIVSNDTGFDEFISVISETGAKLSRLGCNDELNKADKNEGASVNAVNVAANERPEADLKNLHSEQREFLVNNCMVPRRLAESVRISLMVSLENAETKLKNSKAKSVSGNAELKQQIIDQIKAHYNEYINIGMVVTDGQTDKNNKKLHKLQREFLNKTCKIPTSFTDPIRIYLLSGKDSTITKVYESKAKVFKANGNLKQQIIANLNKHYEEYAKLCVE